MAQADDQGGKSVLETHGYTLSKTIGQGSYATVKEAYSETHHANVAIKVISKRRAPPDYLHKFLPREIDVVKTLKHPYLVLFLQCIETTQRVYIIMEYASKGDLLTKIRDMGKIEERQAGIWFGHLVAAMDYCHTRGVVHRDLKCENLLLDDFNVLKVTDFGFARGGMKPARGHYPLSQTYCGSYAYASPEILTGTPYVPQNADIWSMGVVLYVMVFGRLPFDDSNHRKLLKQVTDGPTFPDTDKVSKDCRHVIKKLLSRLESRPSLQQVQSDPWFKHTTPMGTVLWNATSDLIPSSNFINKLLNYGEE